MTFFLCALLWEKNIYMLNAVFIKAYDLCERLCVREAFLVHHAMQVLQLQLPQGLITEGTGCRCSKRSGQASALAWHRPQKPDAAPYVQCIAGISRQTVNIPIQALKGCWHHYSPACNCLMLLSSSGRTQLKCGLNALWSHVTYSGCGALVIIFVYQ